MQNVVRSIVVAGMVGVALGGASYALLATYGDMIYESAQVLLPLVLPQEAVEVILPCFPVAVSLLAALVLGGLGFAVAFLFIGTSLASSSKA